MSAVIHTVFGDVEVETKHCDSCDQTLPITEFRARGEGEGVKKRRYTTCKECERKYHSSLRRLHKSAPPKPNNCESCGERTDKLHLEHCHKTNAIRGWVCEDCNTSIGRAGDDLNGVLNILNYMVERDLVRRNVENADYNLLLKTTKAYTTVVRDLIKKLNNG
jgi:hypothetical protein